MNYSDFVPLVDAAGKPVNPPTRSPTTTPPTRAGWRSTTATSRSRPGSTPRAPARKAEPAYVFSSAVHGDPSTPAVPRLPGRPGGVPVHRRRARGGPQLHPVRAPLAARARRPDSNLYDSQFVMISEFFNFEVSGTQLVKKGTKKDGVEQARESGETESGSTFVLPGGAGAPGDYLYGSMPLNDLWMGMWGIFRVPAKRVADLQPLPTNPAPPAGKAGEEWPALRPGPKPSHRPRTSPTPCPTGVHAAHLQRQHRGSRRSSTTSAGDNDPQGVAYVLEQRPGQGRAAEGRHRRSSRCSSAPTRATASTLVLTNRLPAGRGAARRRATRSTRSRTSPASGTATVTNLVDGVQAADGGPDAGPPGTAPRSTRQRPGPQYYRHQRRRRRDRLQLRHHRRAGRVVHLHATTSTRATSASRTSPTSATCAATATTAPGPAWSSSPRARRTSTPAPWPRCRSGEQAVIRYVDDAGVRALLPRVRGRRPGRPEPDGQGRQADPGRGGRRPGGWCPRPGRPRAARPRHPGTARPGRCRPGRLRRPRGPGRGGA